MNRSFTIGQLAKAVDVNVGTIRYYERPGLIVQLAKPVQLAMNTSKLW